jgi:hypothetical protein
MFGSEKSISFGSSFLLYPLGVAYANEEMEALLVPQI